MGFVFIPWFHVPLLVTWERGKLPDNVGYNLTEEYRLFSVRTAGGHTCGHETLNCWFVCLNE